MRPKLSNFKWCLSNMVTLVAERFAAVSSFDFFAFAIVAINVPHLTLKYRSLAPYLLAPLRRMAHSSGSLSLSASSKKSSKTRLIPLSTRSSNFLLLMAGHCKRRWRAHCLDSLRSMMKLGECATCLPTTTLNRAASSRAIARDSNEFGPRRGGSHGFGGERRRLRGLAQTGRISCAIVAPASDTALKRGLARAASSTFAGPPLTGAFD